MDHDYLWDLDRFAHKPANPPRKDHIGEHVFYENWLRVLKSDDRMDDHANQKFLEIMGCYGHRLDERVATVAATFVTWLGTNVGGAYRSDAKNLAELLTRTAHDRSEAYLWAWTSTNLRRTGTSYGRRQLESSMAVDPRHAELLTSQDYEVIDHLVLWLGSDDGQAFLNTCEMEMKHRQHGADFRNYLEKSLGLQSHQVAHIMEMAKNYRPTDTSKPT